MTGPEIIAWMKEQGLISELTLDLTVFVDCREKTVQLSSTEMAPTEASGGWFNDEDDDEDDDRMPFEKELGLAGAKEMARTEKLLTQIREEREARGSVNTFQKRRASGR